MLNQLQKANDSMNDITKAIVIATLAGLAADWIRRQFFTPGE